MRGSNHAKMNVVTAAVLGTTAGLILNTDSPAGLKVCTESIVNSLFDMGSMSPYVFFPLIIFLYLLGSLLPDADHPYSKIGKIIHLPFKHRTWTHAIYAPIILFILGIWMRPLFWLGLGYFFHLFWDAFSVSGIDWFYPRKHKIHIFKLYHTSNSSETAVVVIFIILAVVYFIIAAAIVLFRYCNGVK